MISMYSLKVPKSRIDGVVFRDFIEIRKSIRQHALINIAGKGSQNTARDLSASCGNGEAWQTDHCVATPIAKPVITRNHAAAILFSSSVPFNDELIRCQQ